jgi:bisphosphoglycerate-dependent phosphoglycerate mutase
VVAHEETLRVFVAVFEGGVPDERLRELEIANCESRCYRLGEAVGLDASGPNLD